MKLPFEGGCLCGAVRYTCSAEPVIAGHCHCEHCRRSSGTGHGSHLGVPEEGVTIRGELSAFEAPTDAGNTVARHFCPACGSAIHSTNSAMPGMVFLRASSLDDLEVFQPQVVVYTGQQASWDKMDPGLPSFEGMPPAEAMP